MALSEEAMKNALCDPPKETKEFFLQQIMLRIKDPVPTLKFYTEVLGMRLVRRMDFPAMTFTLYFMGYTDSAADIPTDNLENMRFMLKQRGLLELTHNWGTESGAPCYHNGNSEPRGFGHLGIVVPDVYEACARFETLGVTFVKKPMDGKMKGIAFVQDPDGYWIEIIDNKTMETFVEPKS